MIVPILYLSLLHTGFTVLVLQSGGQLSPPGGAVTLGCRLGSGVGMSSFTMFWYRQNSHTAALEFVAKDCQPRTAAPTTVLLITVMQPQQPVAQISADDHRQEGTGSRVTNLGCSSTCKTLLGNQNHFLLGTLRSLLDIPIPILTGLQLWSGDPQ
ncbi:hypothetical protein D4764_16G0010500 [Takifugu flavidus]|uniref:Ig-like domain-containing protein n=1 Tax=Takifugu flavidus TaxID=433684 RepID=A0A5C6NZ44_9TELE|nr:hypothetical protein D4764_16G0010500 [Takifugu flavidus]